MAIKANDGSIDVEVTIGTGSCHLRFCEKIIDGTSYFDLRKWYRTALDEQLKPSKKGIMIDKKAWLKVLPLIVKALEINSNDFFKN